MFRIVALALLALAATAGTAGAVALDPIAPSGTFTSPTYVTSDPANPDRLFVVERGGAIKVTENGSTSLFADLRSVVSCCLGERGLLSMALPPDFPETGRFFVYYTEADNPATTAVNEGGDIRVDELHANGATAPLSSDRKLLEIEHSSQSNHNGGQLEWGPDGYLYVGVGDGGGGGDPFHSGQSSGTLLGKILRIDPRQNPTTGAPYSPVIGNPFESTTGLDEIYAYGLRNPWRFSFDRLTGDLLIGDVGQNLHEEVDYAPAASGRGLGANFGWSCREGLSPFAGDDPACATAGGFTDPIIDYPHSDPGGGAPYGCSITGGYVVRDPTLTTLYGRYIYADFCRGKLRSLTPALPRATDDRDEGLNLGNPQSFGEDACGRLYVAEGGGTVARLAEGPPAICSTLGVTVTGSGTVTGAGITCPGDCHESLAQGGAITLTAIADPRGGFSGWGGACAGAAGATCTVDLSASRSVTANFLPVEPVSPRVDPNLVLRAKEKRVRRGRRVSLIAIIRSCSMASHQRVILRRDGTAFGSEKAVKCRATFHPRIRSAHRFTAQVRATQHSKGDVSSALRIRIRR